MTRFLLTILALLVVMPTLATPAMAQVPSEGESFLKAVRNFDGAKAMPMLRRPGNNLVNFRGYDGDVAIHYAVRGRKGEWIEALYSFGADMNIRDRDGETPLTIATRLGEKVMVDQLLSYGADPNIPNRRGESPAILAVHGRHEGVLKSLLERGADPDARDRIAGMSARDYAMRDSRNPRMKALIETTTAQGELTFGPPLR